MVATVESSYGRDAEFYDRRTRAFQSDRLRIIDALPLRAGDLVLDVGCGTGLCFEGLRDRVGSSGMVIGIDQAPKMVSLAAERTARHGWDNVTIVQSPVETAPIPVTADAALFCAVHDVLQSPAALTNVFDHLHPGAWVAAGGGKYPPEWMGIMMIPMIRALHRPYIRSFDGFDRPWALLEEFVTDLRVEEFSFGAGYVAVGRARPRGRAQAGSPSTAWPAIAPVTDRLAAIST
jgi:trans-aconitate methyltransferase